MVILGYCVLLLGLRYESLHKKGIAFFDPTEVIDVSESEDALEAYKSAYEEVIQRWESTSNHPWHGMCNVNLQPFDRTSVSIHE